MLGPAKCAYSPEYVKKLSKKSLGGVSSVGTAATTQLNGPPLPRFGPPGTLASELTRVFGQFLGARLYPFGEKEGRVRSSPGSATER
jgi:hypothetical protein